MRVALQGSIAFAICLLSVRLANSQPCQDLVPPVSSNAAETRNLTATDLLSIRDIGPVWTYDPNIRVLALSPNGESVAFQLRRAEIATNNYCLGLFVLNLQHGGSATPIDLGGDFIRQTQTLVGVENVPSGFAAVITPKWSPDGIFVAFLRRDNDRTQIWLAKADGSQSQRLTNVDFDVEDMAWLSDGSHLVFSGRPTLSEFAENTTEEGLEGILFDDRFIPFIGNRPFPKAPVSISYSVIDSDGTKLRSASESEAKVLSNLLPEEQKEGPRAWSALSDPGNISSATTIHFVSGNRSTSVCDLPECDRATSFWVDSEGKSVIYQRNEGWGRSFTAIYEWVPGKLPRRVLSGPDLLLGCELTGRTLICAHENSAQPRGIVKVDIDTGLVSQIYDPNPEFHHIRLGTIERLHWTNAFGLEGFGDLVLPPGHIPGEKHPLIVVQYESRGFLRGGTDDEYPIQLFANNGFAVLSFQRPQSLAVSKGAKTYAEANRVDRIDWADRRSVQSSLEVGLQKAVETGAVDGSQMGITGLSEGVNMTIFALINSRLFKAAAVSGLEDRNSLMTLANDTGKTWLHNMGYPLLTEDGTEFWSKTSVRMNAAKIQTPLLLQVADSEYLMALEGFAALKEKRQPVEMYVFPDEYHQKWQPSHRLAVYSRSLDWFNFWLKGETDPSTNKQPQYFRWRALNKRTKPN